MGGNTRRPRPEDLPPLLTITAQMDPDIQDYLEQFQYLLENINERGRLARKAVLEMATEHKVDAEIHHLIKDLKKEIPWADLAYERANNNEYGEAHKRTFYNIANTIDAYGIFPDDSVLGTGDTAPETRLMAQNLLQFFSLLAFKYRIEEVLENLERYPRHIRLPKT